MNEIYDKAYRPNNYFIIKTSQGFMYLAYIKNYYEENQSVNDH